MKKSLLATGFLLTAIVAFAQETSTLNWAKSGVVVDGDAHEWNLPLKHYDATTKLFFDFQNDSNNLYLCFQSNDQANQLKILRGGMKLELSARINGKHKASVNFPLPAQIAKPQPDDEVESGSAFSYKKTQAILIAGDTLMMVKGFVSKDGTISSNDPSGLHAAIREGKNNMLTYELAIPLKELLGNDFQLKDLSKDIGLNVIIDAVKRPARSVSESGENNSEGEGGGMGGGRSGGGGMGGRGGGERMGGQGSGQSFDRSALYEKSELKEKLNLALHS